MADLDLFGFRHPEYALWFTKWEKYRYTYLGGDDFIERYVKKLSTRESDTDFFDRKAISYVPAFAKAAVNEIKNSIFQRITDVTRENGTQSYQKSIKGELNGVDLMGSSMNEFIGIKILPELLVMSKVGVFIDMPPLPQGATLRDQGAKHPYLYYYRAEDILYWCYDETGSPDEFSELFLRDVNYDFYNISAQSLLDEHLKYRHIWKENGKVYLQFYDRHGAGIDQFGNPVEEVYELEIPNIPFVLLSISDSLLSDISNYQIALTNMASSDIINAVKANFALYVEQYDPISENPFIKTPSEGATTDGSASTTASDNALALGPVKGRKFAKGLESPKFIAPPAEPMRVSMEKQMQMKAEIRQLVQLAVTNLDPKMASAESKSIDQQGLEAGLSYIGLALQTGERKIALYWSMYEGPAKQATITYPLSYSLKTDAERRLEAESLNGLAETVPSLTFKKEIAKQVATILLGTKISNSTLKKIHSEIDKVDVIISNPELIQKDVETGIASPETASVARGYPEGEAKKAEEAHARKAARIMEAQSNSSTRGVPEMNTDPAQAKKDKEGTNPLDPAKQRGEEK